MRRQPRLPEFYRQLLSTAGVRDGIEARRRARAHLAAILPAGVAAARRERNGKARARRPDLPAR